MKAPKERGRREHQRRSRADACYGWLLRAYPRDYRRRFGDAMRRSFADDYCRARSAGRWRAVVFAAATTGDALWFGLRERLVLLTPRGFSPRGLARTGASVVQDVRVANRFLWRRPAFTIVSVLSLASGVAGVTATVTLARAVVTAPPSAVQRPDRIVEIGRTTDGGGWGTVSRPVFDRLRTETRTLGAMAAVQDATPRALDAGEQVHRVWGWTVSADYFRVLGVTPALGRLFEAADDDPLAPRAVAVVSHRFWRDALAADPDVTANPVKLNGIPFAIVGVTNPDFGGVSLLGGDIWTTTAMAPELGRHPGRTLLTDPGQTWLRAIARLEPGVTADTARAELSALMHGIRAELPAIPDTHGLRVEPLGRVPVPARSGFTAFVTLLVVLAVGLLATAGTNVSGMLLALASVRGREIATRLAIGASAGRLYRQLLIETVVLFGLALIVSWPLVVAVVTAFDRLLPVLAMPLAIDLEVDAITFAWAAATSLVASLLFGLAPARLALRSNLSCLLNGQSSTAGRERLRIRHALVAAQVALSLAIAITAGLFAQSLVAAARIDLGFTPASVALLTIDTTLAGDGVRPEFAVPNLLDRLGSIGGVRAVGSGSRIPLAGGTFMEGAVRIADGPGTAAGLADPGWDVVSPGYFDAIGLPLLQGRRFERTDGANAPRVVIVNDVFARLAWPGRSALGRRFSRESANGESAPSYEVVGVVGNAVFERMDEGAKPTVYLAFAQQPRSHVEIFVRHVPGRTILADVRRVADSLDPKLPIVALQRFDEAVAASRLPQRLAAGVAGVFGSLGLSLAVVGLYGLVAFTVAQRSREMAIRLALGASSGHVRRLVLLPTLRAGLVGAVAGVLMAVPAGRLMASQRLLIETGATDPGVFGGVTAALVGVLTIAALVPARRMVRTNPARMLRSN